MKFGDPEVIATLKAYRKKAKYKEAIESCGKYMHCRVTYTITQDHIKDMVFPCLEDDVIEAIAEEKLEDEHPGADINISLVHVKWSEPVKRKMDCKTLDMFLNKTDE